MNKSKFTRCSSGSTDRHSLSQDRVEAVGRAATNIPEEARLYRLPQVLAILPMSRAKFLKLVKDGKAPPPIKCGRSSFWVASEIRRYMQAQIEATRAARPFDIEGLAARIANAED